jgi:glycine cleavage system regulatory protein
MTSITLLNRMARLELSRDFTRILLALAVKGRTVAQMREHLPHVNAQHHLDYMFRSTRFHKRAREGRTYRYRLTEDGMNVAKLLFDAENEPLPTPTTPDSPPLPFP